MDVVNWASHHKPLAIGGAVVIVLGFLYLMRGNSTAASSGDSGASAYYAAQSAQAQAGDAVQIAQIQAQAGTAQLGIASSASVTNNTTWANTDLAETQSNNAVAPALAQYGYQTSAIEALAGVASTPGSTVSTTKKSSGFLGIGGGSKTTTSYVPDPAAVNASNLIGQLLGNGFNASS